MEQKRPHVLYNSMLGEEKHIKSSPLHEESARAGIFFFL